jgi:hypothetical protein
MKRYADIRGVVAYSPETGEENSANAGDYWDMHEGYTLEDHDHNPMVLVVRVSHMVDVAEVSS